MKTLTLILALAAVGSVAAQTPARPQNAVGLIDQQLARMESQFVPAMEAMPEEHFDFVPAGGAFQDVRTFAQQVLHVAETNNQIAGQILGDKTAPKPASTAKADIVDYVKASFAYAHRAVLAVDEQDLRKLAAANLLVWHGFDHYGQMVVYLRLNGIVPPASRAR